MQTTAMLRFDYTADYWDFTEEQDVSGNIIRTHFFKEVVHIAFGADPQTPRMDILCRTPMKKSALLLNIKDREGVEVLPGAEYSVTTIEPMLGVFGTSEGYAIRVALTNAPTFED